MGEWKEGTLKDIAEIIMGQSPKGEHCNPYGDGMPLLNGPTEFGIKNPDPVQFTTEPKRLGKTNDILFCVRGSTTGRMNWADQEYAIGRGLAALRHKQGKLYRYFLSGIIDYNLPLLLSGATGSTFPNVSKSQLENLEISYPLLPVQRAIASVLSSLDNKIDLLHRQNATLEELAKTLFRKLFVEEAGEDWKRCELGKYLEIHRGLSYKGSGLAEEGIGVPMHNLNSVYEGGGYKYEGIKYYNGDYKERHRISPGDVIVTNTEQGHEHSLIGYPAIIPPYFGSQGIFSQHIYKLEILDPIITEPFLYYLLMTFDVREQIIGATNGSTVNMLPKDGIEWAKFKVPPSQKVKDFTEFARPVIAKKEVNFVQIKSIEKQRDTLLPKLMSGEVQIVEEKKEEIKISANIFPITEKKRNNKFREAILISAIVREFYTPNIGMVSRKWYQKIGYLHKRKLKDKSIQIFELTKEYGKEAAGPYKSKTRYKGPEGITIANGYLEPIGRQAFKPGEKLDSIDKYFFEYDYWDYKLFEEWTVPTLKFIKVAKLGVWATVDYCLLELKEEGKELKTENVLKKIAESNEWKHKLEEPEFSPEDVDQAIQELFGMYNY